MPITPIKLTFEEYCGLPVTNLPHELIDGELRMPAAPNRRHQEISANIHEVRRLEASGQEVLDVYRRGDTLRSDLLPDFSLPIDDAFAE